MDKPDNVFTITSLSSGKFYALIEKINKKARKIGVPPVQVREISRTHVPAKSAFECMPDIELAHPAYDAIEVEVLGEAPYIQGFKLLGTLEHSAELGGVVVRAVPGQKVPQQYWNSDGLCDHCKTKRKRLSTVILEKEDTKEVFQIGKNCIALYLPGIDPKSVATIANFYKSISGDLTGDADAPDYDYCQRNRIESMFSIHDVLTFASAVIRKDGWKSAQMARETGGTTTGASVKDLLCPPLPKTEKWKLWAAERMPDDRDAEVADRVIAWLASNDHPTNEYFHNLAIYARAGVVNARGIGYLASAISSYNKHVEKIIELQKARSEKTNEWVGKEGERLRNLMLTVTKTRYLEGQWSVTTMLHMEDAQGRLFVWFASGDKSYDVGQNLIVTGTVTKHEVYMERKQTMLKRCIIKEEEIQKAA